MSDASEEIIRGWERLSQVLGVSDKTARGLSRWGRDRRCPVFEDYIGPFARRGDLERWKTDEVLPFGVRTRMKRTAQK